MKNDDTFHLKGGGGGNGQLEYRTVLLHSVCMYWHSFLVQDRRVESNEINLQHHFNTRKYPIFSLFDITGTWVFKSRNIQGIRITGKAMTLIWQDRARRNALQTSSLSHAHSFGTWHTTWIQSRKLQNNVVNYN